MAYKLNLIEWGLSEYASALEEEGIDDESFNLLDEETIKTIFKKSGPRLVFKKKFEEYIKKQSTPIPDEPIPISTYNVDGEFRDKSTSVYETVSEQSYVTENSYIFVPSESDIILEDNDGILEEITSSQKRPFTEIWEPSPAMKNAKKPRLESVFPEGLEAVLKRYTDGHIILLNKNKLNNDLRQKLVKIIVNELIIIFGKEIKTSTMCKLTEEITALFPNEVAETYFIPYKSKRDDGASTSKSASGKIWSRYIYVRAALRIANSQKKDNTTSKQAANSPEPNKEEISSLQFLKVGTEPFTKILEAWEYTYKQRRKLYINCEIGKIFTDFPCLRLNSGVELIETDFNKKFPEKVDIIYNTWPKVAQAICEEAKEKKMSLGENVDPTDTTSALLLLPYLFSPVTLKKSRKSGNWRPTRSEVAESFFLQIESFDELEGRRAKRKEKLTEYQLSLQPFGVLVGNICNSNCSYYIIVDEIHYQVHSQVRALELLFKLFHALDIEYPPECEHIWYFIEEVVFQMKPSKKLSSTASVVADIKYHMDKVL